MRTRWLALVLGLALGPAVLPHATSFAQGSGGAPDAVTEMARKRFQEGVALFDKGDYQRARAAFLQAWALKKHPAVLLNLAQSELRGGDSVAAARHFALYLRDYPSTPDRERTEARKGLDEARRRTGLIEVLSDLAGADVLIDGEDVGRTPLPDVVDVSPGGHDVELRLAGRDPLRGHVEVTAAQRVTITLSPASAPPLVAPPPPAPPPTATTPAEEPPAPKPPPKEPPHSEPDAPPRPHTGREPFFSWVFSDPVGLGTAGLTGVGVGMAAVFTLLASSKRNDADNVAAQISTIASRDADLANYQGLDRRDNPCATPVPITSGTDYRPACQKLGDDLDARDRNRTLMFVGVGVAAVGAVGTGVSYFLRTNPDGEQGRPSSALVILPTWNGDVMGLGIAGTL